MGSQTCVHPDPVHPSRPIAKPVTRDTSGVLERSMTRIPHSLALPDSGAAARSLARDLAASPDQPGQLSLMNMLARATGFRNLQHLKASASAEDRLMQPAAMPDQTRVAQALRHFDAAGRLQSWPARTWLQELCLWALWSRLPPDQTLTERQFSARLTTLHSFDDPAILRRTLWEMALITRTNDCHDDRRAEEPPPPEALALIRAVKARTPLAFILARNIPAGGAPLPPAPPPVTPPPPRRPERPAHPARPSRHRRSAVPLPAPAG